MSTTWLFCSALLLSASDGGAPWVSNHHPSDATKEHVREIADSRADYVVVQGGTMDGRNCRSPQGVWQPFEQTWESNRSVRLENVGSTDVVKAWLSNGQNDFRTLDRMVARAVEPGMTAGDKARSLWWQEVRHRFHLEGDNNELLDPVKVFNVYGHNTCGNDSICLAGLWRKAGFQVAPARLVGHCATQVFYDDAWHLMDGDMQSIYLLRDNRTVASEQDLVRDHDLIRRTHTQGILQPDGRAGDEWESSIYVFEGAINGDRNSAESGLDVTLRPGEAIEWRWGHLEPAKCHGSRSLEQRFPDRVCNGSWEYRPDLNGPDWRAGASSVESVRQADEGVGPDEGKTGRVVWAVSSPYVIVGGRLEAEGSGLRFQLSWDGKSWQDVERIFDGLFAPDGPARYRYYLKCELPPDARLRRLAIVNDLQMAPLTLPGMGVGRNEFTYSDETDGPRRVRITHRWVERSASRPPEAPAGPISPADGGEAEGTAITFQWQPAVDPDGQATADYHFELSARADMKWPLSMSFAKLISRTADTGKARYTLQAPGLLNPDTEYFWHVRAKNARGVWGPWSRTWSFTPRGPAPPENVRLELEGERGVLRWAAGAIGRRPARYRVYASDEKGFSISDEPYTVTIGVSRDVPAEFPANLVAETTERELEVTGPNVNLAGANKAFYRVVALDAAGNRGGASDYAAAPRPLITSAPVTTARAGAEYRYALASIRSLGDLRTRVVDGKETMSFWDIERPRFGIERGPKWLAIDARTGVLSGTPDRAGTSEVVVRVTLQRESRRLDEAALKWGVEKVVSTGPEDAGAAKQRFTIEVAP